MSKIWGFGTAAIDIRIKTADYGKDYRDKLLAQESRWFGGGATSNFLVQVVRLGGEAGWLGKLGADPIGAAIRSMLESEGVDCGSVITEETALSPFNVAIYAGDAMRRIGGFLLPNCIQSLDDGDLAALCAEIKPDDWVLIEVGEIPVPVCARMAKLVRAKGARVAIDVDLDPVKQCGAAPEDIADLLSSGDTLMPNLVAMRTLYPTETAEEIAKSMAGAYGRPVILSMGEAGSALYDERGQFTVVQSVPVDAVDTVGAGDAFHGGVVFGLSRRLPVERAMLLGNICGAHNCKTFGARDGMLRYAELPGYQFTEI